MYNFLNTYDIFVLLLFLQKKKTAHFPVRFHRENELVFDHVSAY